MLFFILGGIITAIYVTVGLLLFLKSKNIQILSRSPILLYISHYANLIETLLILPVATALHDPEDRTHISDTVWRLRECGLIIAHYLVYIPYVLRGYRLYFVFNLDKDWDDANSKFRKYNYRTKQYWLIKMLGLLMIPPVALCVFIMLYPPAAYYFPVSDKHYGIDEDVAGGIYVFVCFLEQLLLIFLVYYVRNVHDDFNMTNELTWVTLFWFCTPIFSTFSQFDAGKWLISSLIRNGLLMIRSSLLPVILSFKSKEKFESITLDVLNSLTLIMQNDLTLEAFEKFLTTEHPGRYSDSFSYEFFLQGLPLFEFYIKCELYLNNPNNQDFTEIKNEYETCLPEDILELILVDNITIEHIKEAKNLAFHILEKHFYPKFMRSEEYSEVRRKIVKQEIYTFRVMQTSFHSNLYVVSLAKGKKLNSLIPRRKVESIL